MRGKVEVVTWVGCGEGNCTGWVYNSGFHNVCGHVHLACSFARACRVVIVGPLARELYVQEQLALGHCQIDGFTRCSRLGLWKLAAETSF